MAPASCFRSSQSSQCTVGQALTLVGQALSAFHTMKRAVRRMGRGRYSERLRNRMGRDHRSYPCRRSHRVLALFNQSN